jgi:hypothetical protein
MEGAMARTSYTDQQLLDFSEEHLMYEFNIFRWLVDNIPKTQPSFQLSAYLESFTIHLRALIEFFYTEPKDAKPDDVIAADFFDAPTLWSPRPISATLKDARVRINKEIGHITYSRKDEMDPTKPWPVSHLFIELLAIIRKFVTEASRKKLHPSVATWLQDGEKQMMVVESISASTSTPNTVVLSSFPPIQKL